MLIDYPYEWSKYMVDGEIRTFKPNTPKEIIEKAKQLNEKALKYEGRPYFNFQATKI